MNLQTYFAEQTGTGVLATADVDGVVNTALYARPYVLDDGKAAFVMRERLSRKNLLENPRASYLFKEDGAAAKGIRLRLIKIKEYSDHEFLSAPSRKPGAESTDENRYFVTFRVEKCFRLVGGEEIEVR